MKPTPVRRGIRLLISSLALATALTPSLASASVVRMGVEELSRSADAVVVASVSRTLPRSASTAAEKARGERPRIVTDVELRVSRVLAGERPDAVELSQPGGTLGDLTLEVPEYPGFYAGERCVLFLDAENRVIGGFQGKLDIEQGRVEGLDITVTELARRVAAYRAGVSMTGSALVLPEPSEAASAIEPAGVAQAEAGTVLGAAATIGSITPSKQIAGLGLSVTIAGSGFGATLGKVEFSDGLTLPAGWREASVVSWSDTRIEVTVPENVVSGPVRVTSAGGAVTRLDYDVSFSTDGRRFATWPAEYTINENTSDMTGEAAEIIKAMDTWNACGSTFRLGYQGASAATAYPPRGDRRNEIYFAPVAEGMLAVNYYYWYTDKMIIESDIVFNDNYKWGPTSALSPLTFDLQTVALHELGHTVGLDDQYDDTWRVMGAAVQGQNKRVLTADEIAGAIFLYGAEYRAPTAPTVTSVSHPSQDTWYRSASVRFGFSATASAGIAGYSYVLDRVANTVPDDTADTAGATITSTVGDGESWMHVRAVTTDGEVGPTAHYRVRVDSTAPATAISGAAAGTHDAPVTFSLAASDGSSGVKETLFSVDGSSPMLYTQPVTVGSEGAHTIRFHSVDRAGNTEAEQTVQFAIDLPDPVDPVVADVERVPGADRYAVAANVAREAFPGWAGVTDVVIASGEDRAAADPLAAAGLAGAYDAPVLLVRGTLSKGILPTPTESALRAIAAANGGSVRLHVVGGTATVPSTVFSRLATFRGPGGSIERISGSDRYGLSVEIAKRIITKVGIAEVPGALVANGSDSGAFYDALAASPIAFRTNRPLLLVKRSAVPASVASLLRGTLGTTPRTVVNGTGWASDGVYAAVGASSRLATSSDRRLAAQQIADAATLSGWLGTEHVAVANKLPDALTGGSAMGRLGGPLLYTDAGALSVPTADWLAGNRFSISGVYVVGGQSSISDTALAGVLSALE